MNTTDNAPARVPLPTGHDDPDSPFWISEDLRDLYQFTAIPGDALEAELNQSAKELDREEWLAAWETWRASKEHRLDPRAYAKWLAENTRNADGVTPTVNSLSRMRDVDSDRFKHLRRRTGERRPLTDSEIATVVHRCRMAHLRPPPSAESVARVEENARRMRTCSVCGCTDQRLYAADKEGATFGESEQRCEPCRDLVPLVYAALTSVPDFPTRLGAILANLPADARRQVTAVSEQQLEAWAASDDSWEDLLATTQPPQLEASPTVRGLRRLFGKPAAGRNDETPMGR